MQLSVVGNGDQNLIEYTPGEILLDVLSRDGYMVPAPCGGKGTCGKCLVEIDGLGQVLACQFILSPDNLESVAQPPVVRLPDHAAAVIETDGLLPEKPFEPLIYKGTTNLHQPSLADQRPDDLRFLEDSGLEVPLRLLAKLPGQLRRCGFSPTFVARAGRSGQNGEVLRFIQSDQPDPLGLAVDIGTTTLAAYLVDLGTGDRLGSASILNPQSRYGADVISRIEQASQSEAKAREVRQAILAAIVDLAKTLVLQTGCKDRLLDILHVVLTGNTTMLHLMLGLESAAITKAPFIPASCRALTISASEIGLDLAPDACCQLLPAISAYVGADITAGILATGLLEPGLGGCLLLDIGTNGEMVAVGPNGAFACSTAAGPAFEGANIRCGIGGVHGAIDEIGWDGRDLTYSQITRSGNGPEPVRGICGSGLVAAVSSFLECGLIDETGRIEDDPDSLPPALADRIIEIDGQPAVQIAPAKASASGEPIVLTQKDIRELQNAKAAIAAGIDLLLDEAGLDAQSVEHVFLAGGFGNNIDVEHAFTIGLLPKAMQAKTRAIGNTSAMGAILCLQSRTCFEMTQDIVSQVKYFELSGDKRFADRYIDAMIFPEQMI